MGGTGFIGYHLAKKSLEKGWEVSSISTRHPKKLRFLKRVKYIICDITKKKILKKKLKKKFDYVVNLGGYVDHSNKGKTFKSHYFGCKNLTEVFLKKRPTSFVQMGSSVEYGHQNSPQKETLKCKLNDVKSIYGKAKLLSTKHLIALYKKNNFPCTILRLYLTYGPKQDANRFLPIIITSCLNKRKFPCSNGIQFRDFIYVDDVISAIFKSLLSRNSKGEVFNLGTGKPKKIKKIIEKIKKHLNAGSPQYGTIKLRKDEIIRLYPNIKKIKNKLNWKPKVSFEDGLKKTIKYYSKNA